MRARGFQQVERADEVGIDKSARPRDGVVNVAFGSEVDNAGKAVFVKQAADKVFVADVALDERVIRIVFHFR